MRKSKPAQAERAVKAVAAVALGFVLLFLAGKAESCAADGNGVNEGIAVAEIMLRDEGGEPILREISGMEADVPASFKEELFDPDVAEGFYASGDASVFGFATEDDPGEVFEAYCLSMEGKGWNQTESGMSNCSTFTKEDGVYQWAFLGCYDVGGMTSVVVQVRGDGV